MLKPDSAVLNLVFEFALETIQKQDKVKNSDIRNGIKILAELYSSQSASFENETVTVPNLDVAAHQCAYLHKYAAFHASLVFDMMGLILQEQHPSFNSLLGNFKVCCLGGGPGSDAIGLMAALCWQFDHFKMDVTIIDIMETWKRTFSAVITAVHNSKFFTALHSLEWQYIKANLLGKMTNEVNKAIAVADVVTLVKFLSSTACQDTEDMMRKIFNVMKPGAMVLFIDNAAGGFHQLLQRAANQQGFVTLFGPLQHYFYSREDLKELRFGYTSCFQTRVAVHLLQKPYRNQNIQKQVNIPVRLYSSDFIPPPVQDWHLLPQNQNLNHSTIKNIVPPQNQNLNDNRIMTISNVSPRNQNSDDRFPNSRLPQRSAHSRSCENDGISYGPLVASPTTTISSDVDSSEDTNCACCVIC